MPRTLRALVALLVTLTLAFAACGGDDDDDGGSASGSGSASEPADEDPVDEDAADEDGPDLADFDEDCLDAVQAFSGISSSIGAAVEGSDLEQSLEGLEELADGAPDEIREDMERLTSVYRRYVEVLIETGYDPSSDETPDADTMAALAEAAEELSTDDFTEASENVSAYFEEHCGG